MSFVYPLGLLGLIAIPVLIIIYIIKNKYTEQVIPATYLWTLSERFLKKKNPLRRLTGILSLILQICAVIFISLAVARPIFVLKNAANDYLFIIDASGSMNMESEEGTRFEIAKQRVKDVILNAANGSAFTLICDGETTDKVFENIEDSRTAAGMIDELEPTFSVNSLTGALSLAQEYFSANPSLEVYLVTDKTFKESKNINIIDVSSNEENYSVTDVRITKENAKNTLTVEGKVWSHESDAELNVSLYVDTDEQPVQTLTVNVIALEGMSVKFVYNDVDYTYVKVKIENQDALAVDSQSIIYNVKSDSRYKTLIVTDGSPLFIKAALSSLGNLTVDVKTYEEYKNSTEEYGLYVFDSCSPEALPHDAAVWFFNPTEMLNNVGNTGFTISERQDFGNDLEEGKLENWAQLSYNHSTASVMEIFLQNVNYDDIYIAAYKRCELVRNYHELLYCGDDPVVFAGVNGYGNRQVVFAFDIHDTDLAVTHDFAVLTYNLINYTFPEIIDKTDYICGETAFINVLAGCESIRVDSPLGNTHYLDTGSEIAELEITEAGIYTVSLISGTNQTVFNLYGNMEMSESVTSVTDEQFIVAGEKSSDKRDGRYENLLYLFIILAVVYVADWMVYCYEQYQLR